MTATSTNLEAFRLSPQQKQVWLAEQGGRPRRSQCVVGIPGKYHCGSIEDALKRVVDRHEILRTRFPQMHGMKVPVQVISQSQLEWYEVNLTDLDAESQTVSVDELIHQAAGRVWDLESAPPLYAAIAKLSSQEHVLVLTLPAMCADSWSLRNLVRELGRSLDEAAVFEEADAVPVQYLQFSEWQYEVFESADEDAEAGRLHWLRIASELPPHPKLCFEMEPDLEFSPPGSVAASFIDSSQLHKLQAFCDEQDISTSAVLATCFGLVLGQYSAQHDLALHYAVDGRKYGELFEAIGLFASYVPVPFTCEPQESFLHVAKRANSQLLQAVDLQEYHRSEQSEAGQLVAANSGFAFTYEDDALLPRVDNATIKLIKVDCAHEEFKIHLRCMRSSSGITLNFEYDKRRFASADLLRLAQSYVALLTSALDTPLSTCGSLDMLPEGERQTLVVDWNRSECALLEDAAVHHLFERAANAHPDAVALVFEDQELTYRQLNERANQLAHYLRKQAVGPDVLVGLYLDRSLDSIVAMLGILKSGGAYVPLDPSLPDVRLRAMLKDSGSIVLLTTRTLSDFAEDSVKRVYLDMDADKIALEVLDNPHTEVSDKNLAYVIYTSGSTGSPKGVEIEHRQLLNYIHGITIRLGLAAQSSYATVSTLAADLGHTAVFPALCRGGCLHLVSTECAMDGSMWREYFTRHRIDCLKIVPSHLSALLGSGAVDADALPRSVLVLGGESSHWDMVERIISKCPSLRIFNHYGPTETTVGVLAYDVGDRRGAALVGSRTVPLGRPLANSCIYLLNEFQQPVPIGVAGEVYVGGLGVGRGYLRSPELTASKFVKDPFKAEPDARLYRTGDLARYLPDGNLEFLGRADHQVKIRGYRIELGEIECILRDHPGVRDAIVLAQEVATGEKRLVGYVASGDASIESVELRAYVQEKLPSYMVPSVLVILKHLPLTRNGKVDRNQLPDPESVLDKPSRTGACTTVETVLVSIWEELLVRDDLGVNVDFFELGGHSLLATQVISRIRDAFQVEIPLRALFEAPTIATLARCIEDGLRANQGLQRSPLQHVSRDCDLPLSFSQQRLWFIDQLEPGSFIYNVPRVLRLRGKLNADALQRALQTIVERHEVLRTNYVTRDGEPVQVISADTTFRLPEVDLRGIVVDERTTEVLSASVVWKPSVRLTSKRID